MMQKQILVGLVIALHDLFTAVWIGGMIVLAGVVLPTAKRMLGPGEPMRKFVAAVQRRLSVLVYVSMVGLVLTGMLQSRRSPVFLGAFSFANPYSATLAIKHILVLAMVIVALYRRLALAPRAGPRPAREKLSALLLIANIACGIAVLVLSGVAAAIASAPTPG